MADTTYNSKVYQKQGGDELVVSSGGLLNIETGGKIVVNGTQGAALTAQLTTPDYSTAAITQTTPFGFASAQEAITVLYVVQNLQTRLAEVEARLEAAGIVIAN
jgi:hypothetical protein